MQRCKYPTKTMNITQSYTGTYSHSKNYNGSPRDYPIDDNCGTTGRSYFYAPFDCSIKRIYGVGAKGTNTIWIQSQAPVQTPSFTDYVTIMVIHPNDDTLGKLKVGQVFRQGAAMFLEGNDGRATGYHFHISAGRGRAQGNGWKQNTRGAWVLSTSGGNYPPEKIFYIDPTFTKVQGTKGLQFVRSGVAQAGNTGSSSSSGNYRAGATLTLRADMNVRTGPGTSYRRKKRSELTADGRKHALSGTYAVLTQGTRITVQKVQVSGSQIWIQIPSGWICAKLGSKVYVS